jgi:hypothetical protein
MRLASPDHYGFTKGEGSTKIVPFSLTKHLAASILQEAHQLEAWVACNQGPISSFMYFFWWGLCMSG